jgi:hypothetical protein
MRSCAVYKALLRKPIAGPHRDHKIKETVKAKVIEFYVPKNFRKPSKRALQLQCGKVIEFCLQIKKLA